MNSKITLQETAELRDFMKNLEARRITTPEFKSVLMILRQHCDKDTVLSEWANSVAHKKRNRGLTFEAGIGLWIERFHINAYFASDVPQLKKIPVAVFEWLLKLFRDPQFDFGGIDMKSYFPGGYSRDEIVASINWMYRKSESDRAYKLISAADGNAEDLELMRLIACQLKSADWGEPPYHFNELQNDIAIVMQRLIGASKKALHENMDLLALHFLSAFHLTEIDLNNFRERPRTRCFLSVDSTLSGHLSLNLGLYRRESGVWDSVELAQPHWADRLAASHCYSRPFLCTDLKEAEYFWNGRGSEVSYMRGIKAISRRNGTCVLRPVSS